MQAELFDGQSTGSGLQMARARSQPVRFGRAAVSPFVVEDAVRALEHFNERTGCRLAPFTGRGKPSESLKRIIGAMLDYPEVRTVWVRMIDQTLAAPWWSGAPHVGVIFGPKVVETVIAGARAHAPVALHEDRRTARLMRRENRLALARAEGLIQ